MNTPSERYERWLADYARGAAFPPQPAATVVLLRQAPAGIETLLMRRNPDLRVMGGMWVFPGGRVDPADHPDGDGTGDTYAAARHAAVREAAEEAGLQVDPKSLVRFSHWSPPPKFPHQLTTWFFLAPATAEAVRVDGGEIAEHVWLSPSEAIRRHDESGSSWFLPPTYVTLRDLCPFATVTAALAAAQDRQPPFYMTRLAKTPQGEELALWEGDAGFETGDMDAPGPRNRLWVTSDRPWRLERS